MNINLQNRRHRKWAIDLRWVPALAFAAAIVSGTSAAAADTSGHPGVAFAESEDEAEERADSERRAELILRAESSDRHLQTLADAAEQRARYEHIDNEADARAEAAAGRERELQSQGSDQHLENLAEQGQNNTSGAPSCDSRPGHSTRHCAA